MASLGITISDSATGALSLLMHKMGQENMQAETGRAGVRVIKDHLASKNATDAHESARSLGARPSQLYADFAEATRFENEGRKTNLVIAHAAARQRFEGGTIRAVNKKNLTLPATAEAYGKRASEVGVGLTFAFSYDTFSSRWRPALVAEYNYQREVTRGKNAGQLRRAKDGQKATRGIGLAFFWLVRSVTQTPDPTVLPTEEALRDGIVDGLTGYADKAIAEAQA